MGISTKVLLYMTTFGFAIMMPSGIILFTNCGPLIGIGCAEWNPWLPVQVLEIVQGLFYAAGASFVVGGLIAIFRSLGPSLQKAK